MPEPSGFKSRHKRYMQFVTTAFAIEPGPDLDAIAMSLISFSVINTNVQKRHLALALHPASHDNYSRREVPMQDHGWDAASAFSRNHSRIIWSFFIFTVTYSMASRALVWKAC
jgi:hypothetical protein